MISSVANIGASSLIEVGAGSPSAVGSDERSVKKDGDGWLHSGSGVGTVHWQVCLTPLVQTGVIKKRKVSGQ